MKTQQSSSQSLAVLEEASDAETVRATSQMDDQKLRASFHRLRILGGAFLVIIIIAALMLLLQGDGVTIESFPVSEKTDAQIKKLLDFYNSITGSLSLFVTKPVDLFLGLFMAAAFLSLATNFTLDRGSVGHWQYLPLLTGAALAYLFSNGLNSLNVQVTPGALSPIISAEDLAAATNTVPDQPLVNGALATTWDREYAESASGNSVLNTILRTKLLPQEVISPQCTNPGLAYVQAPVSAVPHVVFGFTSQPWQNQTLTTAISSTRSFTMPLNIKKASELPADAALPSPGNVTSNLEMVAAMFLSTHPLITRVDREVSRFPYVFDGLANGRRGNFRLADTKYKWPSGATPGTREFLNSSLTLWKDVLNATANVSIEHASVKYNRIELSETITFDAVTIELPIKKNEAEVTLVGDEVVVDNYAVTTLDYCSREGCMVPKTAIYGENRRMSIQPSVQVASICVNDDGTEDLALNYTFISFEHYSNLCNRSSNSSMLVISVGIHTEGDTWDLETDSTGFQIARFTKLRTVYSITVGRLAWKTENLDKSFGAKCGRKDGCEGLQFKMQPNSSTSDYLVVGKSSLPLAQLNMFDFTLFFASIDFMKWRSLISGSEGTGQQSYDVLLPRHFSQVTANGTLQKSSPVDNCNTHVDNFINNGEKNHLYMEESLQTSYTAAFYFLFQNAVQRKSLNASTVSLLANPASGHQLEFAGNLQLMNVQVSIPTTNAIVSLVGCLLLLVTSLCVVFRAKRSEDLLQERANAGIVIEAMMNSSKYPPLLLQMALEQLTAQEKVQFSLQGLSVRSVVLIDSEASERVLHVGSEV